MMVEPTVPPIAAQLTPDLDTVGYCLQQRGVTRCRERLGTQRLGPGPVPRLS
jgi:hypothetical protein